MQLKHWKRDKVMYRELVTRGMPPDAAKRVAANCRRWWHNSAMAPGSVAGDTGYTRAPMPIAIWIGFL